MEQQDEPVISTDEMLSYLNLDNTPENNEVVGGLVEDAEAYIDSTFNSENLSASELAKDRVYVSAVKALATSLFYDRSLSQGVPAGVQMMITHLKGRHEVWPQDSKNGKSLPISPTSSTKL